MDLTNALWQRLREQVLARVSLNALALLSAQIGVRLLNLFLIAQVTRTLGIASLGRYLLAMTVESIALAAVDLGLNTLTTRDLSREIPPQEVGALWGTALGLKLLASLCGILALNVLVAPLFFPGERRVLIAILSPALLSDAFNGLASALIKARQRMEISSTVVLTVRLVAVLASVLLVRRGYSERALLIAYGVASYLGSGIFAVILFTWRIRPRLAHLPRAWRTVLSESTPFAITGMVTVLYTRLDLLMLSYWQGDRVAGIYGVVHRLWEALGLIPASFLDALFPELSRLGGRERGRTRLRALYFRGRAMIWFAVATLVLPCLLAAPHVLSFLYGETTRDPSSATLFRVLMLAFPFTFLYLLDGHALYAIGRQRRVTVATILVTAFKGVLNALTIPVWGYWGAVSAAFASELLLYVSLHVAARRFVLYGGEAERAR